MDVSQSLGCRRPNYGASPPKIASTSTSTGWRTLKFFFYLTPTDEGARPHKYILGSHRRRKLKHQFLDELRPLTVAVRVHLVHSTTDPKLNTTLSEADVRRIFGKVDKIWSQAEIHFEIESICDDSIKEYAQPEHGDETLWLAETMPRERMLAHGINVFYVKEITMNGIWTGGMVVGKDTARLRQIPGGVEEPLQRVTAHEIGHALGLVHRQDVTNLMASGTTGFSLNEAEIRTAREAAERKYGPLANAAAPIAPVPAATLPDSQHAQP